MGVYRNHPVCSSSVRLSVQSKLNIGFNFEPKEIRLAYYIFGFPVTRSFFLYQKCWPCDLDLDFWHTFEKKKNYLVDSFWTKVVKAFISQACIPCGKNSPSISKILTLWPWPWILTFEKNLILAISFEPKEIGLSYYRYLFLVARPFCLYQQFWPCDLYLDFWPTLKN